MKSKAWNHDKLTKIIDDLLLWLEHIRKRLDHIDIDETASFRAYIFHSKHVLSHALYEYETIIFLNSNLVTIRWLSIVKSYEIL